MADSERAYACLYRIGTYVKFSCIALLRYSAVTQYHSKDGVPTYLTSHTVPSCAEVPYLTTCEYCTTLHCVESYDAGGTQPSPEPKSKPYVRTHAPVHSADIPILPTYLPTYLRSSTMRCDPSKFFLALRCAAFPAFPPVNSSELDSECVTEGVYSPLLSLNYLR